MSFISCGQRCLRIVAFRIFLCLCMKSASRAVGLITLFRYKVQALDPPTALSVLDLTLAFIFDSCYLQFFWNLSVICDRKARGRCELLNMCSVWKCLQCCSMLTRGMSSPKESGGRAGPRALVSDPVMAQQPFHF